MITPVIMLALLFGPLCAAYLWYTRFMTRGRAADFNRTRFAAWGLGLVFLFTCLGHFVRTEPMTEMLPTWIPARLWIVYATGWLELAIALGLFVPSWTRAAATAAAIVLIAFFPANIYAAFNHMGMGGHQWGPVYLLIRAPLQLILIAWAYGLCARGESVLPKPEIS